MPSPVPCAPYQRRERVEVGGGVEVGYEERHGSEHVRHLAGIAECDELIVRLCVGDGQPRLDEAILVPLEVRAEIDHSGDDPLTRAAGQD